MSFIIDLIRSGCIENNRFFHRKYIQTKYNCCFLSKLIKQWIIQRIM